PISADVFATLAARVGLFSNSSVKRYPQSPYPCRMTLSTFVKRDYIVRHARESDLERLCELETLCWQHTRTSKARLQARLRRYPEGQFVVERGDSVLGVIYSQR